MGKTNETSSSASVSTKQQRIAKLAREMPEVALTTLAHHIDLDWLREAYRRTRKDGAAGVDGQTAAEYAVELETNLRSLLNRAKRDGGYRAPPVRRVHIPKGDGSKTRPIGIPTFEDKVLQRAVAMVLEPIYEQEFRDCSYGFRPRRGAHDALEALWQGMTSMGGGWVLEADIQSFFDAVDHGHLRRILSHRVRDGVLLRLIGKWLNAGVLEQGCVYHPETGTPQGGVISPLLANILLHEVVDEWFERDVKPRMRGRAFMIRYADDFVMVFEQEQDARRVLEVLPKRFGKYGLHLHPEKTRLVPFRRPTAGKGSKPGRPGRPGTYDLLGFTHYWGRSRKGNWVVKRRTMKSRFSRALHQIHLWCRRHRHLPVRKQHAALNRKLRGHDAYYGISGNSRSLQLLRHWTERIWRKWLSSRSRKSRLNWDRMKRLLEALPLAPPRIVRPAQPRAANP